MKQELWKDDDMQYSKVTYSIQWPIHWDKLDESKFITSEEAQQKFINGEFYFSVLWSKSGEIVAIIDYTGTQVSIQIFENGFFEGQPRKVPNIWSVYRAEPQKDYQNLILAQYRDCNRHYNFHNGVANLLITSEFLGHDMSFKGHYDKNFLKPLSITFDDYQTLFDDQIMIQKMVNSIEFVEKKRRRK